MSTDPRGPGLLPGPAPTYLPAQLHDPAEQALAAGTPAATVAAAAPAASRPTGAGTTAVRWWAEA